MDYNRLVSAINKRVRSGKFFTKLKYYPNICWDRHDSMLIFQSKELEVDEGRNLCLECTVLLSNKILLGSSNQGIGLGVIALQDLTMGDYIDFKVALKDSGLAYNRKTNEIVKHGY